MQVKYGYIHIKLLVLMGIVTPTIAASGAYWKTQITIEQKNNAVDARVSELELRFDKTHVDKQTFQDLSSEVRRMHDDVLEIKTMLKHR